jgi:hypothetical protein
VTKGIVDLMEDVLHREGLSREELEGWPDVLSDFHEPAMEFVKPFRLSAGQWAVWQLVSPLVPSLVEVLTSLDIPVYGEIILMIWSFISLAALLIANPFRGILSKIENIILECTNVVVCLVPFINRYIFTIPEVIVQILGVISVGIPLVLVIVLPVIEWLKEDSPKAAPVRPAAPEEEVSKVGRERDAWMSFFAERRPTRTEKLCLAPWCRYLNEIDLNDIPLSRLLSVISVISDQNRALLFLDDFVLAISPLRAGGGFFEEGSPLAQAFPDIRDRVRIALESRYEAAISVLSDFLLSPDSVAPEYANSLEEAWNQIAGNPSRFFSLLSLSSAGLERLKSRFRSEELHDFSFDEQLELARLDYLGLSTFRREFARGQETWPLSRHDLFRVCLAMASSHRMARSLDDLHEIVTALDFDPSDVDAVYCFATADPGDFALLLADPDFSDGKLAAQCLSNRGRDDASPHQVIRAVEALPPNISLRLYDFAQTYPVDSEWIEQLVMNTPDAEEVETQLQRRLAIRHQAPKADVDFQSEFLRSLILPNLEWWWWPFTFVFLPIGWFLGARSVILKSIMEARC